MSLAVVIPVYNESENILATLDELNRHVPEPADVYVVYDFEEDTTLTVLPRFSGSRLRLIPTRNTYGKGALNAIKCGMDVARAEAQGWAENAGESVADLTGLAVALERAGEWYALCLAGPTPRVRARREAHVQSLAAAAEAVRRDGET